MQTINERSCSLVMYYRAIEILLTLVAVGVFLTRLTLGGVTAERREGKRTKHTKRDDIETATYIAPLVRTVDGSKDGI